MPTECQHLQATKNISRKPNRENESSELHWRIHRRNFLRNKRDFLFTNERRRRVNIF